MNENVLVCACDCKCGCWWCLNVVGWQREGRSQCLLSVKKAAKDSSMDVLKCLNIMSEVCMSVWVCMYVCMGA